VPSPTVLSPNLTKFKSEEQDLRFLRLVLPFNKLNIYFKYIIKKKKKLTKTLRPLTLHSPMQILLIVTVLIRTRKREHSFWVLRHY